MATHADNIVNFTMMSVIVLKKKTVNREYNWVNVCVRARECVYVRSD